MVGRSLKKLIVLMTLIALGIILRSAPATAQEADAGTGAGGVAPSTQPAENFSDETDVIIKKLDVSGNFEISDEEILGAVVSKEGDKLSTTKLEEDLQRIFDLGWFAEDVKASLSDYDNGAKVTFRVKENPVVSDILFEGNSGISAAVLQMAMQTKKNSVLNSNFLRKDVETIEAKYHDAGFVAARVIDAKVDTDKNLIIVISEGIIQDIKIAFVMKDPEDSEKIDTLEKGKTKDYVVLREMKTKPGAIYNTKLIGKDLQRVYNLGFFEDVHTRVEAGDNPGKIILVVELEEGKTAQAGFGAGYSSNTGMTGFLSLSERNLMGKGRRASIKLEFGSSKNDFDISYFEPWLDKKQTSLELSLYSTTEESLYYALGDNISSDYEEQRQGFSFTFGRPISDYTRVFAGFKFEDVTVEPKEYYYLNGMTRALTAAIRTDTRDFVFNPTMGRYDQLNVELTGGPLGGDYDYQKGEIDLRRYIAVTKKQVFAVRMDIGMARGSVPKFDYFDLGGVNSLRGYDEYQFTGSKMLFYNLEYRFTMSGNLGAVLFMDAGNCWMSLNDMKILPGNEMHKSFGIGLRLKIPAFGVGPVRLDYAIAQKPRDTKIHFGFGHMF